MYNGRRREQQHAAAVLRATASAAASTRPESTRTRGEFGDDVALDWTESVLSFSVENQPAHTVKKTRRQRDAVRPRAEWICQDAVERQGAKTPFAEGAM